MRGSLRLVPLLLLLTLAACPAKPNEGPPAKVVLRLGKFDGQTFSGDVVLNNEKGGAVSADGKLTVTLIAGKEELCSGSVELRKENFRSASGDVRYPSALLELVMSPAPCPHPPPAILLGTRVELVTPEGVTLTDSQVVQVAIDWARALQAKDVKAGALTRIPSETKRLGTIVDLVPKAGGGPVPTVACPPEVKKGAVARILHDHLLEVVGRAKGEERELFYAWASDKEYARLAGWNTKVANITEGAVAEALGDPKPFVQVVRVDSFIEPQQTKDVKTKQVHKTKWTILGMIPGSISGGVFVVDVAKRAVVCSGPVVARSSEKIVIQGGDSFRSDLRNNFEASLASLETSIAKAPLR